VLDHTGRFVQPWSGWFRKVYEIFNTHGATLGAQGSGNAQTVAQSLVEGIDATVKLAPLAAGGNEGSATFKNGVLTAYTAPT
jgi:hypothetical protein